MRRLPIFLDVRGRAVMLIGTGAAADAKARLLQRAGARIVGEDAVAALAIIALDADADAEAAAARLRARGILVNAVDRPALCDFTLPAIVDREPVLIAIGTGGISAGLAKALRQRLEALLPAGLGRLAEALHAARPAIRARWPDAAGRRGAIDDALSPGARLDPLADGRDVAAWLATDDSGDAAHAGQVARIDLSSADPDELTLRQARLLAQVDRVYYDTAVPAAILDRARADAARIAGPAPVEPPPGLSVSLAFRSPDGD